MKNPAYMEVHQHNKTACQKSGQMVFFSQAVVSFCIELFCVVTLQYQMLVRIAIAYFIIEKKKAVPQPWQAIAQRFCSPGIFRSLLYTVKYYKFIPQFIIIIKLIISVCNFKIFTWTNCQRFICRKMDSIIRNSTI